MTEAILQIYAQELWHDEARIVGTREGIEQLRDHLQEILDGQVSMPTYFPTDGEGYFISVEIKTFEQIYDEPITHYAHKSMCGG